MLGDIVYLLLLLVFCKYGARKECEANTNEVPDFKVTIPAPSLSSDRLGLRLSRVYFGSSNCHFQFVFSPLCTSVRLPLCTLYQGLKARGQRLKVKLSHRCFLPRAAEWKKVRTQEV